MAVDEMVDVELASRIKPPMLLGDRLAKHPIGADHARPAQPLVLAHRMIEHQQMIADRVEPVDVAAG